MIDDIIFSLRKKDIKAFLSMVKISDIDEKDEFGYGIIHIAIAYDMDCAVKYCIENNADLNIQDAAGLTGLHYCAEYNNLVLAKLLADNGALFDIANNSGSEPLWTAVYTSRPTEQAMLDLFLQYTGRVNTVNKYGKTPLDFAKLKGDESVIKALESKQRPPKNCIYR